VLDCKNPDCQDTINTLPSILEYLCPPCRSHHERLKKHLGLLGIAYHENPRMVRGLDYYVKTTFEITSGALGAQNSLLGGGRYDGLVEQLGGPPTHGFGFALGLDRFVLALPEAVRAGSRPVPDVHLAPLGETARELAQVAAARLRRAGFAVSQDFQDRSLKSHLRHANRLGVPRVVIIGDAEAEAGQAALKSLITGDQILVPLTELEAVLRQQPAEKE